MNNEKLKLVAFDEGDSRVPELNLALAGTWQELIADPASSQRIAETLGIPVERLRNAGDQFTIETNKAGFSGAELVVVVGTWLATEVVLDVAKDLLKDALKAKLKQLWIDVIEPAMRKNLPKRDSLGTRKDSVGGDKPLP